jgi:hypothetical protein
LGEGLGLHGEECPRRWLCGEEEGLRCGGDGAATLRRTAVAAGRKMNRALEKFWASMGVAAARESRSRGGMKRGGWNQGRRRRGPRCQDCWPEQRRRPAMEGRRAGEAACCRDAGGRRGAGEEELLLPCGKGHRKKAGVELLDMGSLERRLHSLSRASTIGAAGNRSRWLLEVEDDGQNCSQGEAPAGKMEAREAAGGRRPWRRSCAPRCSREEGDRKKKEGGG